MSKPTYEELEKRVKELEKIEQSLQASEEKYRSVFDSVGSSIVIVDKDGIITDINPHHVENIGKGKTTKDDYIGKNIIEHPSVVKAGISKLYRKVLEGETIEQKDVYFPSLTGGGDGYYNIKSSPLKEDNKIIGAVMVHEDVTEIKIHRENLEGLIEERTNEVHENEKLFRLLMDSTSDGYFDHNLITDEVYYGEKCEEMLGYAPGEIKHHLSSWQSLLHPEDVPGITKEVKDLLEGKTDRFVQEYRFRNKTDDWQWLLSRAKIVEWDDDGRPTRLVGTHQDITERKKAEEALRFNEERFRSLFSSSTAGIAFTTLDGQFVDVNEAYLKILGYTVEELKKLTYSDLTPGKWHKMETGILSEAINTGHTRNFEKEYIGKDGTIIPVFVNACVMKDLEGNANRLGAIVTDITERKRAEEKIKESDERFELAMKATEDGIWDWDIITNEVYRSPGYLELIGYESHELDETPNRWWELMHQDDRERVRAALYKHIEKKSIYDEEFRILTKGGECRWFRSCGKAIWDDKGNPIRMVGAIQNITARKKAEKALEESMSLLADSQKSGNVGSWSWDLITGEAVWSEQLYHIYGRDIKLGIPSMESYLEAYHPDDRESLQNVIETSIKKDTPYIIDYRIFRENTGEERWLHSEGKLEKDNNGNPIRLIGISVDITDRKRAEEQLFENEKLLKTVTENVKDAIFSKDIEGRYTFVNPIAAKMLGLTEKEIIGKRAEDILSEEDAAIIKEVDSLNFKGEPVSEVRQLQIAGVENFLHTIQTPVFDNNGEIIGISGSVRDITKHKKAEEALRISSEKYEDIFRVVPTLMAVSCLEDGKYLEVNDVFAEVTGYSKAEVIGKTPNELDLTAGAGYRDKMKSELKKHGRFQNVEVAIRRKDGEIRDGLLFGEVFEADGQKRLLSLWTDITERRQLEEQLQIRQRMDSLGTLAGGIAHDFNNILVGIMGNIDLLLLEADMLSDLQKESLNDAMISCERAANLIRQFQVLSRGAIRGKSTVDIYDISVEVFSLLKETTDRLITKQIRFNKDEYFVTADSGELHQVLLNLATNSAQAIEERGAEKGAFIRIKAEDYESGGADKTGLAEGNYIHISFEDSGIGMSDEVMKKAFDPMFTTKEIGVKKGQGLGLAMVYNIITRINNGHVYIDSKEGKGTTFHIYLPKTQSGPGAEHKTPADLQGGTETILVVDDEPIVIKLSIKFLTEIGYTVLTAGDGNEALNIYKQQKDSIHAVILDLSMPQMSGKQVFQEMQKIDPDIKVIISSGHGEEYTNEGILAQAKGSVSKPYKIEDLAQMVRIVLDS